MRIEKETYKDRIETKKGYIKIVEKERDIEVYKINELTEDKQQYIKKHLDKANDILRKAAMKYARHNFINLSMLDVTISNTKSSLAYVRKHNDAEKKETGKYIRLNINSSYLDNVFKRKYNKELLESIMHEYIHIHTQLWFNDQYSYSRDCSPVFCATVSWFNKQFAGKYNIGLNDWLEQDFKMYQKQLYNKIYKDNISWNGLITVLFQFINLFEKKLDEYNKELSLKYFENARENKFCKSVYFLDYNSDNEASTYCEVHYYQVQLPNTNEKVIFENDNIILGIDLNPYEEDESSWSIKNAVDYICNEMIEDGEIVEAEELRYYDDTSIEEPQFLGSCA